MSYDLVSQETKNKYKWFTPQDYRVQLPDNELLWCKHKISCQLVPDDHRWYGRKFETTSFTRKGMYHIRYKLCINCFDVRRYTYPVYSENEKLRPGICSSCHLMPPQSNEYYNDLYHCLLTSDLLGKDFETQFRENMLCLGYYVTFPSTGTISIRNKVQEEVRPSSVLALVYAAKEDDSDSSIVEIDTHDIIRHTVACNDAFSELYASHQL